MVKQPLLVLWGDQDKLTPLDVRCLLLLLVCGLNDFYAIVTDIRRAENCLEHEAQQGLTTAQLCCVQGPVGRFFQALPQDSSTVQFEMLGNTGHCPHDDSPDEVHRHLVPWLSSLGTGQLSEGEEQAG